MQRSVPNRRRSRRSSTRRPQLRFAACALVPTLVSYAIFRFYPLGYALYMSLHDWKLLRKEQIFVGLGNYRAIFSDPIFLKVVANTLYYALAATLLTTLLALIVALVLNPIGRGSSLFRLIYFLPQMTSTIAAATIWLWLYQPRFGLINQLLGMVGIPAVNWLGSTRWAMPSIIIFSIWGGVGFNTVIFLAGLKSIPAAYYEAAAIDGASGLQMARHITLPLLNPVITFTLVTGLIGGFNVFQQVYLLTRGGPQHATRVLALQIYDYAFSRQWMGQAASMAFVLFAIVLLMTIVQLNLRKSELEF